MRARPWGRRSTTVRQSPSDVAYSAFRYTVLTASAASTIAVRLPAMRVRRIRDPFASAPSTERRRATAASTASAANGRYMRRSAPTSLVIGITLDVGASVRKNAAARNPMRGQRTRATPVRDQQRHHDKRGRYDVADRRPLEAVHNRGRGVPATRSAAGSARSSAPDSAGRSTRRPWWTCRRSTWAAPTGALRARATSPQGPHTDTSAPESPRRSSRTRTRGRRAARSPAPSPSIPSRPCRTHTPESTPACHLTVCGRSSPAGPDRAVQRQQEEERHQRFRALRDVVHRVALERMEHPE